MSNSVSCIERVQIFSLWNKFDIDWNLSPDINVLSGYNGTGKSTIFDCICSLLHLGKVSKEIAVLDKIIITFDNGKFISFERELIKDTIKNIEKKAKKDATYQEILSDIKEKTGDDYRNIKSLQVEIEISSFTKKDTDPNELTEVDIEFLEIEVISTFDSVAIESEAVKKLSNNDVKTDLDWKIYRLQKEYLDYQLNMSRKKDHIIDSSNDSDNIKNDISLLNKPYNFFIENINLLFSNTHKKIDRKNNELSFLLDDEEINTYQLSSGEKQLIIILLTVLLQDKKPAILFMDEPEISLHLDWQRCLLKLIRELNPNVQILTATHSPGLVMDGWLDKVSEISDIVVSNSLKKKA